jgi:hypothetical protein
MISHLDSEMSEIFSQIFEKCRVRLRQQFRFGAGLLLSFDDAVENFDKVHASWRCSQ